MNTTPFTLTLTDGIPATPLTELEAPGINPPEHFQATLDPVHGLMFFVGHTELTTTGARALRDCIDAVLQHLDTRNEQ